MHIPHSTSFLESPVLEPIALLSFAMVTNKLNIVSFNLYPPKGWKNPMKVKMIYGHFLHYLDSLESSDHPDSFWIVQTVYGLSGQFLDCPDSFWILRTVFGLSGQFLDCPESFWIVRTVC